MSSKFGVNSKPSANSDAYRNNPFWDKKDKQKDDNSEEIPMYPTHAIKMIDNSCGDEDILFLFAYKADDIFYSYDTNNRLLNYEGDEILRVWKLN